MTTDLATALRGRIAGRILERGDAGVADAIAGFNEDPDLDPDLVVIATTEEDIVEAVRAASAAGVRVRPQATGHGAYLPMRGGMLVITSGLDHIDVDLDRGTVTLGAGVRWRDVMPLLRDTGRTLVTGSSPSVGAVGLALGGGIGPLVRSYGMVADHVESFGLVTGAGELVEASADRDPELFWALKGGKVGLGVVTRMTLRLIDVGSVIGGGLFWDGSLGPEIYPAWLEWTRTVPETVNTSLSLTRFPDIEPVPAPLRGRQMVHLRFVYAEAGRDADALASAAEPHLAALRAFAPVEVDTVGPLSPSDMGTVHGDPDGPLLVWDRGVFLDRADASVAAAVLELAIADPRLVVVETRHFGGALADPHSAAGGRGAQYGLFLIGAPVAELFPGLDELWLRLRAAVADAAHPVTNLHWLGGVPVEEYRAAWTPATAERIDAVRRRVDPAGLLGF